MNQYDPDLPNPHHSVEVRKESVGKIGMVESQPWKDFLQNFRTSPGKICTEFQDQPWKDFTEFKGQDQKEHCTVLRMGQCFGQI